MRKEIIQTISFIFFMVFLTLGLLFGCTGDRFTGLCFLIASGYIIIRETLDEKIKKG